MRFTAAALRLYYSKYGVGFKDEGGDGLINIRRRLLYDNIFHDEREAIVVVFYKNYNLIINISHFPLA